MTLTTDAVLPPSLRRREAYGIVILAIALFAMFLVLAYVGAEQVARGERAMGVIDPLIQWVRTAGKTAVVWLITHAILIGQIVTASTAAIVAVGFSTSGWPAWPLALLAIAASSVTWGEIMLLADRTPLGEGLYALGLACAFGLGIWCPIRRLPGFLDLHEPRDASSIAGRAARFPPVFWEYALVMLLTLGGLVLRLYALPELPNHFDGEMIESMVASRTGAGFRWWIQDALVANSGGLLHLLPRHFLVDLFGSSIYSVRLSAVLYGVAAIPLIYWLVRRLAGWAPAVVSTLLLLTAPEQLFWSRNENVHFSVIAVLALVTAHIGVWMFQRFSPFAVMAAAMWMPVSRLAYGAGIILFLYPIGLLGHALLFVRGMWRKVWYVVPLLAAGAALWFLSLSILYSYLGGHWRYIDPVSMQGGALWRKQGQYLDATPAQLVILQARSITSNFGVVARNMADHVDGFSHWNERVDLAPRHMTIVNVGTVVIAALGVMYLLAQLSDRRSFALLLWVVIGVLPGLMSNEPADRRIAAVYPAMYAVAGLFVGAVVRVVRHRGGRVAAWLTTVGVGLAIAGIASANLVSHFLLPTQPTALEGPIRFVQPMFDDSHIIIHNVDQALAMGMLLGNLDRFLAPGGTPCIQAVKSKSWLDVALNPRCDFSDRPYVATMSKERAAELRMRFHPRQVSFLLQDMPYNRMRIGLLRALFPAGVQRTYEGPGGMLSLFALTVNLSDVAALHSPTARMRASLSNADLLQQRLLAESTVVEVRDDSIGDEIRVGGGLLLKRDGWYRIGLAPECPVARFSVDGHAPSDNLEPMMAGLHPFELALPSATACQLPVDILVRSHDQPDATRLGSDQIVGPAVVEQPLAQAPQVAAYPGYGEAVRFGPVGDSVLDLAVERNGDVTMLVRERDGGARVQRVDREGHEKAAWRPQVPAGRSLSGIAIDSMGTVFVFGSEVMLVYDRNGHEVEQWKQPDVWPSDVAFWHDDLILTTMRDRGAVALLDRHGKRRAELREFEGGPGRLLQPMSVTADSQGSFLVVQEDGLAVLFDNPQEAWHPTFVRSFPVAYNLLPPQLRRGSFDAPDRVLLPEVLGGWVQAYNRKGERLMATNPAHDLDALNLEQVVRIAAVEDALYVVEMRGRVWRVARSPDATVVPRLGNQGFP